jgi:Ohr subfamily peroxiredoxin
MSQDTRTGRERPGTTTAGTPGRVTASDYSGPGVEAELDPRRTAGGSAPGTDGHGDYDTLYIARASSAGGRGGRVTTDDGLLDLEMRAPRELGGPGGAPNPEQLLAAAYATCFHSSLELVAGRGGVNTDGVSVDAAVALRKRGKSDDYAIGVEVTVRMPQADRETAGRLAEQAHRHCPYSKALLGSAEVGVRVA